MPVMWFATDGPRPTSQTGPGISVTTQEVQRIVGKNKFVFVGEVAPSINSVHPSNSLKNVVLEVEDSSEISSLLPRIGFYIVADLHPLEAQNTLKAIRGLV